MRKLLYVTIVLAVVSLLLPAMSGAMETMVSARWDSTNVVIMGRTLPLHVEVVQDRGASGVLLTSQVDTLAKGVEVARALPADTVDLKNNRIQINQTLLIQAFDSGLYQLPPVIYLAGNDTVMSEALTLKVLPVKVDTTAGIADFKPVLKIRHKFSDFIPNRVITLWWLWLLIIIMVVAMWYGLKAWRRYKAHGVAPWQQLKKRLPPYEEAIERLKEVERLHLWQQGRDKEYFTEVTDALRVYIERRFSVTAVEMTTSQIMDEMKKVSSLSVEVLSTLNQVLEDADLVKFADIQHSPDINASAITRARDFLEATKPLPETEIVGDDDVMVKGQTPKHEEDKQ